MQNDVYNSDDVLRTIHFFFSWPLNFLFLLIKNIKFFFVNFVFASKYLV